MKMSMIKKCVVMMLMIMLVVTQVKCITTSQEFRPIIKGAICEIKCDFKCAGKRLSDDFDKCVKDCEQHCTATVKTKTLP
jgi:hypothetical protein